MNNENKIELARELSRIRQLPHGPARTAAAEAVTRKIESAGVAELLPWALLDLVEAYTFSELGHKSFVIFARILQLWDTRPELFDESDTFNLFWEFKWVVSDLCDYPQISKNQAEELLADMRRRYEVQGLGMRSVEQAYYKWYSATGDPREKEQLQKWLSLPHEPQEDCEACMVGFFVNEAAKEKDWEKALREGQKQQAKCNREPYHTWVVMALAAMELGDVPFAAQKLREAFALEGNENELDFVSRGTIFEILARGGMLETALSRLRTADKQLLNYAGYGKLGPVTFFSRLAKGLNAALQADPSLGQLPTGFKDHPSKTAAELFEWAFDRALRDARELDARNGNSTWENLVHDSLLRGMFPQQLDLDAVASPLSQLQGAVPSSTATDNTQARSRTAELDTAGNVSSAAGASGVAENVAVHQQNMSPSELFARAENSAASGDFAGAAELYREAAAAAEDAGELLLAGHSFAEAAHCYQLQNIRGEAFSLFQSAADRLRLAGADLELRAQVLQAWAPLVETRQQCTKVDGEIADLLEQVSAGLKKAANNLVAEALGEKTTTDPTLAEAAAQETKRLQIINALMEHIRASVVATGAATPVTTATPDVKDLSYELAAEYATNAAIGYTNLGMQAEAGHAHWLLGKIQAATGDIAAAIESLDRAFHCFVRRLHDAERAAIADELLPLLRQSGRNERAELLISEL